MGKKSNRKKQNYLSGLPAITETNITAKRVIVFGLGSIGLFIWSAVLFGYSFIPSKPILISLISGGVAGALLLNFIWRPALNEKRFIYFLGLVAGAAASFFILTAGNYFFSSQKTENKILVIEKTGNQFKRKRHCRTPYAVVNFDGERKKLKFSCEYEQTIGQYKKIDLTLSKGFFNYYVILERRLIQ